MSTSFNNMSTEIKNSNDTKNNNMQELLDQVFNFDLFSEPLPDFDTLNKEYFLKIKKYSYKRKYNELNNDSNNNTSPFIGRMFLKTK